MRSASTDNNPFQLERMRDLVSSAAEPLGTVVDYAVPLAGAAAAVAVMIAVTRHVLSKKALARRVKVCLLPTDTFDPTPEEIIRFAGQLSRVRPAVSLAPRHTAAVRLRLATQPGGLVRHEVHGPARAASVLRLAGYAQVDLRPVDTDTGAPPDDDSPAIPDAELAS